MNISINKYNLSIKTFSDNDYNFVYSITKRNIKKYADKYWGGWNAKKFKEDFNPTSTKIILHNNRRIGLYQLEFLEKSAYIRNIQISNKYRNKGLGNFFMKKMEEETTNNNYNKIQLQVFKENPAINLYKRLDYKIIKDKNYSVIMEKQLKN